MKRKLRFFCDYMADTPLWEGIQQGSYDGYAEDEYNKSKETLLSFGVNNGTILLMDALQFIFEWAPCDEPMSNKEEDAFYALQRLSVDRLEKEIGDKFEIEVV